MIKQAVIVVVALCVLSSAAFAQEGRWNIDVNGAGVISRQTRGNGTVLTPTNGSGLVASLERRLGANIALQFNFGHDLNSQKFLSSGATFRVKSTNTEFSGDILVHILPRGKFKPFVFGGAGGLVFNPDSTLIDESPQAIGAKRQTRTGILYGVGADYPLVSRFTFRLQYRGLIYSPPDYGVPGLFTSGHGHMAEPAVGLVFNF